MRVVVAVDPTKSSEWVESALTCFPLGDSLDVVVVSAPDVRPPPRTSPGPPARRLYGAAIAALHNQAAEAAGRAADILRERLAARAATVTARVARDAAAPVAIVQAAACWSADLILTGPSTAGRFRRAILGSVPDDIARTAHCPVLMLKRDVPTLQRVLVATDGSVHAEAALRFVATFRMPHTVQVRVSAVSEPTPVGWVSALSTGRREEGWGRRVAEIEHKAASRAIVKAEEVLTGLRCPLQSSLRAGEAAAELVKEVDNWRPDLLVFGARGRTTGPDVALGRVAESLLQAASCPLLVVRA